MIQLDSNICVQCSNTACGYTQFGVLLYKQNFTLSPPQTLMNSQARFRSEHINTPDGNVIRTC